MVECSLGLPSRSTNGQERQIIMQDLKTYGVYRFTLSDGGAKPELLISIKKEYQGKPLYEKGLQRQFDAHHEEEHPYLLRYVEMRDVDGLGRCLVIDWEVGTDTFERGARSSDRGCFPFAPVA